MNIERSVEIRAPLPVVFAFYADVNNHPRVSPAETGEQLVSGGEEPLHLNSVVTFRARYGMRYWTLTARITAFEPPNTSQPIAAYFRDEQIRGPFARWKHHHVFRERGPDITVVTDRFDYEPPLGLLGWIADLIWLRRRLWSFLVHVQQTSKRSIEEGRRDG